MNSSITRRSVMLLLGVTLLLGSATQAADWPQWRGAARDGRSADSDLLKSWPESGPPLAWKASGFGGGFSSVAVAGERIYTMGDLQDAQYVIAAKRSDGKQLWKTKVAPAWKSKYLGPRSTPTVDGDRVYVVTTEGDVYCLAAATGEVQWKRSLPGDFDGRMMRYENTHEWKFSESPLVDGDKLIVTPGVPDTVLVALDKKTGKDIWRAKMPKLGEGGDDGAGYSSVVVSNAGGVKQYVQFVGRGVIGVEAETGRFLWGYNRIANRTANIATPIIDGDHVFVSSGYDTGSALLKLNRKEDDFAVEEVYWLEHDTMQNHHGGSHPARRIRLHGDGAQQGLSALRRDGDGEGCLGPGAQQGPGLRRTVLRRRSPLLPLPERPDGAGRGDSRGLSRAWIVHDPRRRSAELAAPGDR